MPACSEKPEAWATSRRGASGSAGSVCSVNTFWPSRGPAAIRYVIEAPSSALIGASSVVPYAPLEMQRADLDTEPVASILARLKSTGKLILEGDTSENQQGLFG